MGICDSVPEGAVDALPQRPPRRRTAALFDMMTSPSNQDFGPGLAVVEAPDSIKAKHMRLGEKTASQIAGLFSTGTVDDWVPKANPHYSYRMPKSSWKSQEPRSAKMIKAKSQNSDVNTSLGLLKTIGNESSNVTGPERVSENNTTVDENKNSDDIGLNSTPTPVPEVESDNFQVNDHNLDTETQTWRPMKVDKNGDLKPVMNELLTNKTSESDENTWLPSSGPSGERD